jgi:Domain of unknown function (DUF4411)
MSTQNKKTVYVLDTNILINFGLFVPVRLNPVFWDRLETLLIAGDWVLLDAVVGEVKHGNNLKAWCKKQTQNGHVKTIETKHKIRGAQINNQYQMVAQHSFKSEVDTYIIAYAEEHGLGVFTREGYRDVSDPAALYKIPDVCKELGIKFERIPEKFLKEIGF